VTKEVMEASFVTLVAELLSTFTVPDYDITFSNNFDNFN
jgi:hypothetical protein